MALANAKLVVLLLFLLVPQWGVAQDDRQCLQEFKNSVTDPTKYLDTWDFTNANSNICRFFGVTCFSEKEPPVYKLELPGASLSGRFPEGLSKCSQLTTLDLSDNSFQGPISSTLCEDVRFMVILKLRLNKFTGAIPENLGSCTYLNELRLDFNQLSDDIPASLVNLNRLKEFNVSHNKLSGIIPYGVRARFNDSSVYSNNAGLCGAPLKSQCDGASSKNTGLIIGIAIGVAVAVFLVTGLAMWWYIGSRPVRQPSRRDESRWIRRIKAPKSIVVSMFEQPLVKIKLSHLMAATGNFSQSNVISSGRTGTVYKGILTDGSVMAIKRLQVTPHTDRQFKAEMETLGMLKHRNLVPLLGYCIAGPERLLVFKHMPNGTLQDHLRDCSKVDFEPFSVSVDVDKTLPTVPESGEGEEGLAENGNFMHHVAVKKLDWETRLKVAIGAARGLAWLHHSCNPRVIHRNISPGSIVLDEEFEPKISDFGFARLINPVDTHISTFVNGDFGDVGYVAPEYVRTLVATVKGDVYSFGVVLLELITGNATPVNVADENFKGNLAEWILFLTHKGNVAHAIDKSLTGAGKDDELMQFLKIGASCVAPTPKERPSMYEVFHMLRSIGEKYHLTDHNDEIPLASSTGDVRGTELTVPKS